MADPNYPNTQNDPGTQAEDPRTPEQRAEDERKAEENRKKIEAEQAKHQAANTTQGSSTKDPYGSSSGLNSPRTGTSSVNPSTASATPETNDQGALVPNINRIPGDRDYDPADELKPVYDVKESEAYAHPSYMTKHPDPANPNDLQSPLNPRNMDEAHDPYATPKSGSGPVRRFDQTRPGDPTNPTTKPEPGTPMDPSRSPSDPNKPVEASEIPDLGQPDDPDAKAAPGGAATTYSANQGGAKEGATP